jgi:hypothetical protein
MTVVSASLARHPIPRGWRQDAGAQGGGLGPASEALGEVALDCASDLDAVRLVFGLETNGGPAREPKVALRLRSRPAGLSAPG